jgi:hypothetical protein
MVASAGDQGRQRLFVVGMGGGGGALAVSFQRPPRWLSPIVGSAEGAYYPVEVAVFDTNEQAQARLAQLGFTGIPYILTGLTRDQIIQMFVRGLSSLSVDVRLATPAGRASELISAGAGRHPLLARQMAIHNLAQNREVIAANLRSTYEFRKGAMVTAHTVNGGTGSGIAPVLMDFFGRSFFEEHPGLALDIAILPEMSVIKAAGSFYPANAIVSLYQLLRERTIPDAIILADNDHIHKVFGAKNNTEINERVRSAMIPLMLCSEAIYAWPHFGDQPDLSNIRTFARPGKGFGLATFCALGYSVTGGPGRLRRVNSFFADLVDRAFRQTTVDLSGEDRSSSDFERPDSVVAVLVASPDFYRKRLGNDSSSVESLVEEIIKRVGVTDYKRCLVHYIAVPHLQDVMLSMLVSGIESAKLRHMWSMALQRPPDPREPLVTSIRSLPSEEIEDLAFAEIRDHIDDLNRQP